MLLECLKSKNMCVTPFPPIRSPNYIEIVCASLEISDKMVVKSTELLLGHNRRSTTLLIIMDEVINLL